MYYHFINQTRYGLRPFEKTENCTHFWNFLRKRIPHANAVILMPDHYHLLVETNHPNEIIAIPSEKQVAPLKGLEPIWDASLACTRYLRGVLQRKIFIQLAYEQGWGAPRWLQAKSGVSIRTIQSDASTPLPDHIMNAARLCLGVERLRKTRKS